MTEPLGDKIITWLIYIFAICWGLGWVINLLLLLIEKFFPKLEQKVENLLQTMYKFIKPIMKYSLIAVGILLLIHLIASWLEWIK